VIVSRASTWRWRRREPFATSASSTLTLETEVRFATPADQAAFAEALTRALSDLVAQFHDESAAEGRSFRFMIGGHPVAPDNSDGENDDASEQTH